jgi:hypothetical protein
MTDQLHPDMPPAAATFSAPHSLREFIDRGATTVEQIHVSIANLPLDMIGQLPRLAEPMKAAKEVQGRWIGQVYSLVRKVNGEVARFASDMTRPKEG